MNPLSYFVAAHARIGERRQFIAYEGSRDAGCQMLEDAVAFFPTRLEAVTALRQILECKQSATENHAAPNALAQYADRQQREETTCQ